MVECVLEEGEVFDGVFVVEDGGAGDDEVRIHGGDLRDGGFVDTAIDADEELRFPLEEGFDFCGDVVEEEFFAGVGADAEEENVVDLVEVVLDEADGGSGVEGDAADDVLVCGNAGEGVVDVCGVFDGERDEVCASFGEGIDMLLRLVDEKVDVLEEVGLETCDEGRANGDVWPDVPVHDIEVEKIDVIFLKNLKGRILIPHVVAEGSDGELRAGADEVDFFGACHDGGKAWVI